MLRVINLFAKINRADHTWTLPSTCAALFCILRGANADLREGICKTNIRAKGFLPMTHIGNKSKPTINKYQSSVSTTQNSIRKK